jgi:sulfonate transport system ATP-binding protein
MAPQLHHPPALAAQGATVTLERLAKRFGEREVLRDIDARVAAGEFVAVIGPSGGGKTTLLRIVAGLDDPSGGAVEVRRADGSAATSRVMFQEDRLLPWKRVIENVAFGLPAGALGRAQQFLDAVGLGDRAGDFPNVLSGGQKQRVALARALAHQPDLLLLDEPFGALDALTRAGMQRLLEDLWRRERPTVILITHDVEEALLLADRVVLLQEGRLLTDLRVGLPRPRHRGDPWLATHKEELLEKLLAEEAALA